jgi:RHH-type rel operon transcriptional repressor/antitoxin RelB
MPKSVLSVRVPDALHEELAALSKATQRSQSFLVEQALSEYVRRQAWQVKAIDEAIAEADARGTISGEAIEAWLASWGSDEELPPPLPDTRDPSRQ